MRSTLLCHLAILILFPVVYAQTDEVNVPTEVRAFVEKGSKPIFYKPADLNGDGRQDAVLVIERTDPPTKDEYDYPLDQRPMLILVRGVDQKLSESARNERVVMCSTCGGMMGDPFVEVEVGTNMFTVDNEGGSAWRWGIYYEFKYSRIDKTWQLVRLTKSSVNSLEPNKTAKSKVLTPRKFGKINFSDLDPAKFLDR